MSSAVETNRLHPRVAVSGLCFPTLSAVDAVETIAGLGVGQTSLSRFKLREAGADAVIEACRRHGVNVVATTGALALDLSAGGSAEPGLMLAREEIDLAAAVGARTVYGVLGRRVGPRWDATVDAYVNAVGELVEYARERNITLAIEPVGSLYADLSFVHSFRDALVLARRAGMGICLDLFHVWTEGTLREDLNANVGMVSYVQLSDLVLGDRALPAQSVPGEGDIPLAAMVGWLLEAGYDGAFDCEIGSPRVDAIGHREGALRAAVWLDALLVELGA